MSTQFGVHVFPTFPKLHSGQEPIAIAPGHPHPDEQLLPVTAQKNIAPLNSQVNSQIPEHPATVVVVLDVDELVDDVLVDVDEVLVEVELVDVLVEVDDVLVDVDVVDVLVEEVDVDVDVDVEVVLVEVELVEVDVDEVLVDVVVDTHSDSTQVP